MPKTRGRKTNVGRKAQRGKRNISRRGTRRIRDEMGRFEEENK